jgi:hypothetical protein
VRKQQYGPSTERNEAIIRFNKEMPEALKLKYIIAKTEAGVRLWKI